ncbi:MAG: HAD family phosphatase [Spirochaetaceae bacterium]|nr:MAG: HAD family phosphatase [Spirochaetaceae bacterium]
MISIARKYPYRLVVFDLDGTLVDENLQMTAEDLKYIKQVRRGGIEVTLATGRTFRSAVPYIHKLDIDLPVILCNGAAIVNPKTGNIMYQEKLHPEAAILVVEKTLTTNLDCLLYTDPLSDCPVVSCLTPLLSDFIRIEGLRWVEINDLIEIVATDPPIKVQVVGYEEDTLIRLQRDVAIRVPEISIVMTQGDYLEVMPVTVSKGSALERLGKLLKIPLSHIVAFGDSLNDLELLSSAGIGIALADAPEELKEEADMTVPSVAAGLKELLSWSFEL